MHNGYSLCILLQQIHHWLWRVWYVLSRHPQQSLIFSLKTRWGKIWISLESTRASSFVCVDPLFENRSLLST